MDITQIYSLAAGGIFVVMIVVRGIPALQYTSRKLAIATSKYLIYPFVVRRHRLLGPWSPVDILLQLLYIALNAFCVFFRVTSLEEAEDRAGTLSIVNMAPTFFGPNLSPLADLLGLSLSNYRQMHRSAGTMSSVLVAFQLSVGVYKKTPPNWSVLKDVKSLVVSTWTLDRNVTYASTGFILSSSSNDTLDPPYPQAIVRILSPHSPSAGVPKWINGLATLEHQISHQPARSLCLCWDLWSYISRGGSCYTASE